MLRVWVLTGLVALVAGCGNHDSFTVNLGSASLGEQLMDLKRAQEAGVITEAEYLKAKGHLLVLLEAAADEVDD